MFPWPLLIPLGFLVGTYGAIIGAGGAFVLVPALLYLYPQEGPTVITTISLAVVFFNSLSGTTAYLKMGRVDLRGGLLFGPATIPGTVLGAYLIRLVPRPPFQFSFGLLLLGISLFILIRPEPRPQEPTLTGRRIIDGKGQTYYYSKDIGVATSFGIGFIAGLFGIGGALIQVPVLIYLLNFPTHIATATSLFVLAITSFSGTATHLILGDFTTGVGLATMGLSLGVVVGAQLGASLSNRFQGPVIARLLALGLAAASIHLISDASPWR